MKNWDLFVSGPELAIATMPRALNCSFRRGVHHAVSYAVSARRVKRERADLESGPNLVGKGPTPYGLPAFAGIRRVAGLDHEASDVPVYGYSCPSALPV